MIIKYTQLTVLVHFKRNTLLSLLFVAVYFLFTLPSAFCQTKTAEQHQEFDRVYGLNPELYNGRKYYRDNYGALGHPYWINEEAFPATLSSEGQYYPDLRIKYELNKQFFILEFRDYHNALQMIILNDYAIDTVFINGAVFIKNSFVEIRNKFIQLVHSGYYSAYISHTKQFLYQGVGVQTGHKYSEEIKEHFLVSDNKVFIFKNKSGFLRVFKKEDRKEIKSFISSNNIKFRKLGDGQFKNLVEHCNQVHQ